MKTALLFVLAAILAAPRAPAAPLERDLGQGLTYIRAHAVPADLPAPGSIGGRACVLDVRYVPGGRADGAALLVWLRRQAGVRTPVILLANEQTSGPLLGPLNSPDAVIGLVIIGPVAPGFSPDIGVAVSRSEDRRAYEALEKGASVESLVTARVIKSRNDEAALARARLSDNGSEETAAAEPAPAVAPVAPAPAVLDPVLQRAVQLQRTLLALRRL